MLRHRLVTRHHGKNKNPSLKITTKSVKRSSYPHHTTLAQASNDARFTKRTTRNQVHIPENYHIAAQQEQSIKAASELRKKKDQEQTFFKANTQPGDYTVYKSRLAFIPQLSTALLAFVGFSNSMMFEEWANHQLFDLPGPVWYAAGIGCLAALGYGHHSISSRWVKRIEARIHAVNTPPKTLKVVTANFLGGDSIQELPLEAFRGLNASEQPTVDNMNKLMISIDVSTPQKYLILWRTRAHFANPANVLTRVLGLSTDKVNDIFVTSKGHTFEGKLYSDEDYQMVVNRLLQEKQGQIPILPDIKQQLEKISGSALTFEKTRALGILKDEQEQEQLTKASNMLKRAHELSQEKNHAELSGLKEKVDSLAAEIASLTEDSTKIINSVISSIKYKNEYLIDPIIDFNGFRKENAVQLFKDVITSQMSSRHPLTSSVKFVFGPDADVPGSPSNQLKTLANMYLTKHSNIKYSWGKPGTEEFGVLTLQFKQKEQFDPSKLDVNEFKNMKEIKL